MNEATSEALKQVRRLKALGYDNNRIAKELNNPKYNLDSDDIGDAIVRVFKFPMRKKRNVKEEHEPWRMTKAAHDAMWKKFSGSEPGVSATPLGPTHKEMVRNALSRGRPVPANVLADYPDLVTKKRRGVKEDIADVLNGRKATEVMEAREVRDIMRTRKRDKLVELFKKKVGGKETKDGWLLPHKNLVKGKKAVFHDALLAMGFEGAEAPSWNPENKMYYRGVGVTLVLQNTRNGMLAKIVKE